eukprot:TRINITY_DN7507_c0_g1_i2.p2 TRINITY_DN7507_c0_g1~~TRINITY_DN7507_c0_g1_i2.p2  ORF type:complete len:136 (+),score=30.41 TRINITY_DN7507_c0_g1_i2:163-570(+)
MVGIAIWFFWKATKMVYERLGTFKKSWEHEDLALILKDPKISRSLGDQLSIIHSEPVKKFVNDEGCLASAYSFVVRGTRGQGEVTAERVKIPGKSSYEYRWLYYDNGRKTAIVQPAYPPRIQRKPVDEKKERTTR